MEDQNSDRQPGGQKDPWQILPGYLRQAYKHCWFSKGFSGGKGSVNSGPDHT